MSHRDKERRRHRSSSPSDDDRNSKRKSATDNSSTGYTLFVGGISNDWSERDIRHALEKQFGTVVSVSSHVRNRKGYCFVDMKHSRDFTKAVEAGTMTIHGRTVNLSEPKNRGGAGAGESGGKTQILPPVATETPTPTQPTYKPRQLITSLEPQKVEHLPEPTAPPGAQPSRIVVVWVPAETILDDEDSNYQPKYMSEVLQYGVVKTIIQYVMCNSAGTFRSPRLIVEYDNVVSALICQKKLDGEVYQTNRHVVCKFLPEGDFNFLQSIAK
eukprot:PhF_6_TR14079/c0_g1_i2/m.22487